MGLEEMKSKYVWINGKYVPWADANIHICSHVIHYGSGVFEGIRCYKTPKGTAIFRQKEHTDRLFNSAKTLPNGHPVHQGTGEPGDG